MESPSLKSYESTNLLRSRCYEPTLIIHGGAGVIRREHLSPELYQRYRHSLLEYLASTRGLLDSGASALDAACHAVSLLEDDPLFNCGRGSVFTTAGSIEMEASIMVTSLDQSRMPHIKRTGAVSGIRNTRHPILLAREVLVDADEDQGLGGTNTMHCHLNGRDVEEWGWSKKGLEKKPDDWFWTKRRWDEHRRGLHEHPMDAANDEMVKSDDSIPLPSQGTVGAVCFDRYGLMAVATSTGGLTNKAPGRIGDTPSVGTGFWAESWTSPRSNSSRQWELGGIADSVTHSFDKMATWAEVTRMSLQNAVANCLPTMSSWGNSENSTPFHTSLWTRLNASADNTQRICSDDHYSHSVHVAVAMSGTGNGDSFLRTAATHSAAALCHFVPMRLQDAITRIAGINGELQESAGSRWMQTGEGQGGIIGIEARCSECACGAEFRQVARIAMDFNCEGMWRAYYRYDSVTGKMVPDVMVFRDRY